MRHVPLHDGRSGRTPSTSQDPRPSDGELPRPSRLHIITLVVSVDAIVSAIDESIPCSTSIPATAMTTRDVEMPSFTPRLAYRCWCAWRQDCGRRCAALVIAICTAIRPPSCHWIWLRS